jgi:hypothetical protein
MNGRNEGLLRGCKDAALVMLSVLFLSTCASADRSAQLKEVARAEEAIKGAERSGVQMRESMELNQAKEKLAKAKDAYEEEKYKQAGWLAEEALVCARLAEAKRRTEKTRKTIEELENTIETLQNEIDRKQSR